MDVTSMSNYLQTQYDNTASSASASKATSSISGISENSSREEIEDAVKEFESYFMEQVIKQVKESMTSDDDDEDSTMSQYKDLYIDTAISEISSQLVDQVGGTITDDFVDQIMRNYGISEDKTDASSASVVE